MADSLLASFFVCLMAGACARLLFLDLLLKIVTLACVDWLHVIVCLEEWLDLFGISSVIVILLRYYLTTCSYANMKVYFLMAAGSV